MLGDLDRHSAPGQTTVPLWRPLSSAEELVLVEGLELGVGFV